MANGRKRFFIEKKDGTKIGYIVHFLAQRQHEIGTESFPVNEEKDMRRKQQQCLWTTFFSKKLVRIQANADEDNMASQRVLEKVGFTRGGILRKVAFEYGAWRNAIQFSILREEWKKPIILAS